MRAPCVVDGGEQPLVIAGGSIDEQVVNGVAVAFEGRLSNLLP